MTWKKTVYVDNQQITLDLPASFRSKRVTVVVEDIADEREAKLKLMQEAAVDPLYQADMADVQNDFQAIDGETL
ncbi:hypothetical protein [Fibrella arboris]|uniref:hypothetical protein n=1 Tax=Fibrella arboris TaxID=3242486 RepID=UPI003522BA1D